MIYIGLPVHDEEHTAGVMLWRIRKLLVELDRDFQIVLVDDASTDRTPDIVEPYRRVLPLTVLRNERREGYAGSLERIIRYVLDRSSYHRRDALLTLQADFTDAPEAIPSMIRRFESGADLVAGAPSERRQIPRGVRAGRLGASLLDRVLPTPPELSDPFGGFRVYRLFTLDRAISDLPSPESRLLRHDGWAANVELLLAVRPHARQVDEVEYSIDYTRRYRPSRFRFLAEMWGLVRAGRDRRLSAGGSEDGPERAREAS